MSRNYRLFFNVLCFYLICFSSFSQNLSYKIFSDSIIPIAESNYVFSKEIYLKYQKKYCYDPSNIHNFLRYALSNNDIDFFKKESIKLMDAGFRFKYTDTLIQVRNEDTFYELIYQNKLNDWLVKETTKRYPKYWKSHPKTIEYEIFMYSLLAKDQLVINYANNIKKEVLRAIKDNQQDSTLSKVVDTVATEVYMKMDFNNIQDIAALCRKNDNQLPTNFDCPYLSRYIELSYFHVMKNSRGKYLIQTWDLLHTYFEDAYVKGVINDAFFSTYDHYLEVYFGKQYYGTRSENVPMIDPDSYLERKQRLGL